MSWQTDRQAPTSVGRRSHCWIKGLRAQSCLCLSACTKERVSRFKLPVLRSGSAYLTVLFMPIVFASFDWTLSLRETKEKDWCGFNQKCLIKVFTTALSLLIGESKKATYALSDQTSSGHSLFLQFEGDQPDQQPNFESFSLWLGFIFHLWFQLFLCCLVGIWNLVEVNC